MPITEDKDVYYSNDSLEIDFAGTHNYHQPYSSPHHQPYPSPQHQTYLSPHNHPMNQLDPYQDHQTVYTSNVYYLSPEQQHQQFQLQLQQFQGQQYISNYPPQVMLQRYNSNGSTSSTNSQTSCLSAYNGHYAVPTYSHPIYDHPPNDPIPHRKRKITDDMTSKKKQKKKKNKRVKIVDPNAPPKPKRKTGLNKPMILSVALSELMDGDKELSRPALVQKLWKYIKANNLQDPADRRFILCDDKLKKIFNQDRINSFGMNKDLSAHLTKKEEERSVPPPYDDDQSHTQDMYSDIYDAIYTNDSNVYTNNDDSSNIYTTDSNNIHTDGNSNIHTADDTSHIYTTDVNSHIYITDDTSSIYQDSIYTNNYT
ncbi:hypothetical protein BDB01DRAFT_795051 [Pilobolus umbonatus]|nr:hypothetical protein BDB01DRAFT_795051 [Pilobolus umbonatus]